MPRRLIAIRPSLRNGLGFEIENELPKRLLQKQQRNGASRMHALIKYDVSRPQLRHVVSKGTLWTGQMLSLGR